MTTTIDLFLLDGPSDHGCFVRHQDFDYHVFKSSLKFNSSSSVFNSAPLASKTNYNFYTLLLCFTCFKPLDRTYLQLVNRGPSKFLLRVSDASVTSLLTSSQFDDHGTLISNSLGYQILNSAWHFIENMKKIHKKQ